MGETLKLTPSESVTIVDESPQGLEVEAVYGPGGSPPPKHWHPNQDEHFRVLEGELRVRVDGEERTLAAGEEIEIPRGAVHQMWNPGGSQVRARWQTRPAGRTADWFRDVARAQEASDGAPGPLAFGVLLTEYRDVFRLAGPDLLLRPALAALAVLGRARGHRAG